jgi:hypothetical protein
MNEQFEKWWSKTVSRGYETKKLDEMYKVVTQAAFEAGQAESAARIAELETERNKIYKAFVGRDGMHMSLYDALAEIFKSYWELETDCTAMAEALLEAHVKTWIKANAITIAAKYGEGK